MDRKTTVIAVCIICALFIAVLAVRLVILSGRQGIFVSVSQSASQEEIMTPGGASADADEDDIFSEG